MGKEYLLGVDVGTYSSKGVLVDSEGAVVADHQVPHGMDMPEPGLFEQDADRVWWHDFKMIVQSLLATSGVPSNRIRGIGASAIGPCVLPLDGEGRPLRPGILYGIDARASEEIEDLEKILGREQIFQGSGTHLDAQACGPKILWIRRKEPEVYAKTRWFVTSQSYLVYKLTGRLTMDHYTACGYGPLYDIHRFKWNDRAALHITPPDRLPKTTWSCDIAGQVTAEAARETGLAQGTPVITGTIDAAAEAVSTGVADAGDMMCMFGSSIFFIMKTQQRIKTEHFWSAHFLEPGTFAFMGGMSTSGSLTTWFRDRFARKEVLREQSGGESAYEALSREAAQSSPGANGLIALPYFEGERTPLHDPKAKGVLFGLGLSHTRGDIYRALLEGVGYGIRHNLEAMGQEGVSPRRILAVGGGTKNPLWMQSVADIANVTLLLPGQSAGACYGDAFMAGVGVGMFKNLGEINCWVKTEKAFTPNPENHQRYGPFYRIFRSLYDNTRQLMHELPRSRKGNGN